MANILVLRTEQLNLEKHKNHIATDWEVSDTMNFSNIIFSSKEDKDNLNIKIFTDRDLPLPLDISKKYYSRARFLLSTGYTRWSNHEILTTINTESMIDNEDFPSKVSIPIISTHVDDMDVDINHHDSMFFRINVSGFDVIGNSSHLSTSYFIEDIEGNVVWYRLNSRDKNSILVDDIMLRNNSVYRIYAMFHTTSNDSSQLGMLTIRVDGGDKIKIKHDFDYRYSHNTKIFIDRIEGAKTYIFEILEYDSELEKYNLIHRKVSDQSFTYIPAYSILPGTIYITRIRTDNIKCSKYVISRSLDESVDGNIARVKLPINKPYIFTQLKPVAVDVEKSEEEEVKEPVIATKPVDTEVTKVITYHPNGGLNKETNNDAGVKIITYLGKYRLLDNPFIAPEDKIFGGWSKIDTDKDPKLGEPGDEIELSTPLPLDIYAIWYDKPIESVIKEEEEEEKEEEEEIASSEPKPDPNKYKLVKFMPNGGISEELIIEKVNLGEFTFPLCNYPAPEGKEFFGWGEDENGSNIHIVGSRTTFTTPGEIIYHAIWRNQVIPKKRIVYKSEKGEEYIEDVGIGVHTLPENIFVPPEGKVFGGWGEEIKEEKSYEDTPGVQIDIKDTKPKELHVIWKDAPKPVADDIPTKFIEAGPISPITPMNINNTGSQKVRFKTNRKLINITGSVTNTTNITYKVNSIKILKNMQLSSGEWVMDIEVGLAVAEDHTSDNTTRFAIEFVDALNNTISSDLVYFKLPELK